MKRTWALLGGLALAHGLLAQQNFSAGGAAAPLDAAGASARALGMGGAFVGLADDAAAVFYNPAGLGGLSRTELALHHHAWLADVFQEQAVLAAPLGGAGGLGLSVNYLDFGVFEGRDATGRATAGYTGGRVGGGLAYGRSLGAGFSAGLGAKGFSQTLERHAFTAFSADLGLLWEPREGTRFGASYLNLGTALGGATLSAPLLLGASQKVMGPRFSGLLAVSGAWEAAGVNRVNLGLEAGYRAILFLRAGYRFDLASVTVEGLNGISVGVGFTVDRWAVDYAWLPQGDLGSSQRLSLSHRFGPSKTAPAETQGAVPVSGGQTTEPAQAAGQVQPRPSEPAGGSEALKLQFSLPPDRLSRARTLEAQGRRGEAIGELNLAVRENGADPAVWRALAEAYYRAGRRDYAVQCFEQALRLKPDAALEQWLKDYKQRPQ